jgi:hypothetical protein
MDVSSVDAGDAGVGVDASMRVDAGVGVDAGVRTVLGEGACETAADCVVGEAFAGCGVQSCTQVARSRGAQQRFKRDLVRRCGGASLDRMPCQFNPSGQAVCEQHRCALVPDELPF